MDNQEQITLLAQNNRFLKVILGLLVNTWPSDGGRIELLLADNGLSYQEIAELLHKKPDAVRMLLKRNSVN